MALYDAFISYSHAKDKPIAAALQSTVQTLGKAWYKRRSLRVFRDDTSFSATPHLWPTIEAALSQSRFLILLASGEAAASPWVGKEVAYWLEHKSIDTLLIAMTDGELQWDGVAGDFKWSDATPLPPVLKGRFPTEPKWVDLRAYREGASKRDVRFTELSADFAAAVHGMPKEDLLSQEVRQQRRALTLAWSAVALLIVLGGAAAWQWKTAVDAEHVAQAQRQRAEETLNEATLTANGLVTDLTGKFRQKTGMPRALVRDILERAQALQKQLLNRGETSVDLQQSAAVASGQLSETLLLMGDTKAAIEAAQSDCKILEDLLAAGSPTVSPQQRTALQTSLAFGYRYLGYALEAAGRREEALAAFQKSLATADKLAQADPKNTNVQLMLATAYEKVGDLLVAGGKSTDALAAFRKALAIREQAAPDTAGESYGRIGDVLVALGQREDALAMFQKAVAAREKQVADDPSDAARQEFLDQQYVILGRALEDSGRLADALSIFQKAKTGFENLAASDSRNIEWQVESATIESEIAEVLLAMGRYADALAAYQKGQPIFEKLAAADPDSVDLQRHVEIGDNNIGGLLMQVGKFADALVFFQKAVAICDRFTSADHGSAAWQRELAVSYGDLADALTNLDRVDEAIANYQKSSSILEKLVAVDPGNTGWQHDLSVMYEHLAGALNATHRQDDALAAYQKAQTIDEQLAAAHPNDLVAQMSLAIGYIHIGDMMRATGKLDDALSSYQKSLVLAEKLVSADQANAEWQRQLHIAYERIGVVLRASGKLDEALVNFQKMVAVCEKLADRDDARALKDLENGYYHVGDVLIDLARPQDALQAYGKALAIAAHLATMDPTNARWDSDKNLAYQKIATAQIALGRNEDALDSYRQGGAILEKRAAAEPANTTWQRSLSVSYDKIGALLADMGRYQDALVDYQAATRLTPSDAAGYWNRGRAEFFLQQPAAAANDFAKAFQLDASYSYDVIWLHIARQRAGQDDKEEFAANTAKISESAWPWPIIALYQGSVSPADVRASAQSASDAKTQAARTCEADFYSGLHRLDKGDQNEAIRDLKLAADECPAGFYERTGAAMELGRLRDPKSASSVP
jgi:tetratricopeptide (TPR) repeat protein